VNIMADNPTRLHVAICIATFRRPEGLRSLLDSLNLLAFVSVAAPRITVVIVDNDCDSQLTEVDRRVAHPSVYRIEPTRGLAAVRNACLDLVPGDADMIAFVDDDEWVEPLWLDALLAMQAQTGADIVQGVVMPVYPRQAPYWMRAGGYHEVGPFADGAPLAHGASGNILILQSAIQRAAARFHPDFNMTGGEDVDFFHHLLTHGCRMVAASGAVAYETVPLERMTLGWILKRRFRTGHTLGAIARRQGGVGTRLLKATGRLGVGALQAVSGLFGSPTRAVMGLTNMAWALGTWSAFNPAQRATVRQPE
jgi:succinoglycan biosynthesis protein ExoM